LKTISLMFLSPDTLLTNLQLVSRS